MITREERTKQVQIKDIRTGESFLTLDGKARYTFDFEGFRCTNVGGTPGVYKKFDLDTYVQKIIKG